MKNLILFYVVFCFIGCATAQKHDDSQNNCVEIAIAQEKLSSRVTSPVPIQGFDILADSIFALCKPLYDSIPENLDGYYYFDIHLYISKTGKLLNVGIDNSKIFGGFFESQKSRVSFFMKDWHSAKDKMSTESVNYSINILSRIYGQRHEIIFSNIQHDRLASYTAQR